MKRISVLFLSLIALTTVFVSCDGNKTEAPTITVTQDVDTVYYSAAKAGTTVTFTVVMTPDVNNGGDVSTFIVTEGTKELLNKDLGGSASSKTETYAYVVSDTIKTAQTISLTFEVQDADGRGNTKKAYIYVMEEAVTGPTLVEFTGKTLNYNNAISSWATSTPFFDLDVDGITAVAPTAAVADIDLGLTTQITYKVSLASPDASWYQAMATANGASYLAEGKNHTKLQKVTVTDWATVTAEYIDALTITESYVAGVTLNGVGVTNLANGEIIAFETADGVKGLLKVTNLSSSVKATASITCDGKIVVPASSGK